MADVDALVIGAGPNGLVAANVLADAGVKTLVLEAQPTWGGACRTVESTLPGFLHDVGAAFFPFGSLSPAMRALDLPSAGLVWRHATIDTAHPSIDGTCGVLARDVELTAEKLGPEDGPRWKKIHAWFDRDKDRILAALLGEPPPLSALGLGFETLLRLGLAGALSGRAWSELTFRTPAAQRIAPGLALHTDVGPADPFGAVVGVMLALTGATGGFGVPEGGAGVITDRLVVRLKKRGASIATGTRVARIVAEAGRVVAVVTARGEHIRVGKMVIADVGAPALYRDLLDPSVTPQSLSEGMRNFPYGFGTFKMDWALAGPVPWIADDARDAAVVHTGDDMDDLERFTREVREGKVPSRPYLVIGQPTLADPTRAPEGKHVLWAYSRVPFRIAGGWPASRKEAFADAIDDRIEELAPGFKKLVLARKIVSPEDLEALDENLVGGDLGGGSAAITNQLIFRPTLSTSRYRTPVRGLYLGSSYAHPGAGVHGMCGWNAAHAALKDAR
jgi:phytoene dehydrogenase-like protein